MNHPRILPFVLLAVLAGSASAQNQGNVPANRLVGVWKVDVAIGPCSLPNPVVFFSAYGTFHAGGTLSDTNWTAPTYRGPGQGVWAYKGNGQYASRFQFFRFDQASPAPATGFNDVRVLITLDAGGNGYSGVVNARQLDLAGNPVGPPLCGQAIGTRLGL
ncbi:MAG: hypothetical protein M3485_06340 [Pseudomonadota bacterium]|nr:hypothetical protein [Pseudomonadota bacterium]